MSQVDRSAPNERQPSEEGRFVRHPPPALFLRRRGGFHKRRHDPLAAQASRRPLKDVNDAPDLILTQNLCTVCAVSSEAVNELCATDAEVVALDAHTLAEIEERILSLAGLLGVTPRGRAVVGEMEAKVAAVNERVSEAAPRPVFVAEWLDPPFAAGHWIPEMVAQAGGREVLGRVGAASYPTSWETVRAQRPGLVIVAPCGFDHRRAAREASLPPLGCRAVAVDSNAYYARPGPRVADGVAQLAFLIHPELVADPGLPYVELAPGRVGRRRAVASAK
jgi:iron complex transport system substrate-binding protein